MKRRDLIKRIDKIAKSKGEQAIYSEGGRHTHVRLGELQTTIPRHNEVNELTARGIIKYLEGK